VYAAAAVAAVGVVTGIGNAWSRWLEFQAIPFGYGAG
jgi:hypothetical protein